MSLKIFDQLSVQMNRMRTQINEFLAQSLGMTDAAQARIYKAVLNVQQDQLNLSMLYQAQSHKQLAKHTATKPSSIRGLAEVSGHSATRPISARGTVKLRKTESFAVGSFLYVAPSASLVCTTNNLVYTVAIDTERKYSLSTNAIELPLIQGKIKTQTFIVDATNEDTVLFTVRLDDEEYIEHYSVKFKVNNVIWTKADSLMDMPQGSTTYFMQNGVESQVDIICGDSTHGTELRHGDLLEVEYMITNGELGILSGADEFTIVDGFTNSNGDELTDFAINRTTGFLLASNGENPEVTRNLIGYSSRAFIFARPSNLQAYLSRLSILSHVGVWADKNNDLIMHVLALPSLNFLNSRDYLNMPEDKFSLTTPQKDAIKAMINNSKRQKTTSEIIMENPNLKRYSMFVYVKGSFDDTDKLKNDIKDVISEIMLAATFKSKDKVFDNTIVNSNFENGIYNLPEVGSVQVNIFSQDNELAKSNGYYYVNELTTFGASRIVQSVRKTVTTGENPNLGLDSLNSILVIDGEIPILRPISLYSGGTLVALNEAVTVFAEIGGIFRQI